MDYKVKNKRKKKKEQNDGMILFIKTVGCIYNCQPFSHLNEYHYELSMIITKQRGNAS